MYISIKVEERQLKYCKVFRDKESAIKYNQRDWLASIKDKVLVEYYAEALSKLIEGKEYYDQTGTYCFSPLDGYGDSSFDDYNINWYMVCIEGQKKKDKKKH